MYSCSLVSEKELQKLYKNFSKIDKDKSGTLEPEEFFDIPGKFWTSIIQYWSRSTCTELANNPLVKRVIAVLDKNKDGNISFLEFVQGLNSLSAGASQEEKLRFAFAIYDINGDGFISNGELFMVLKMMVGNNLNDVQLQQLVDRTIIKADTDFDGKISFEEFCTVSIRNLTVEMEAERNEYESQIKHQKVERAKDIQLMLLCFKVTREVQSKALLVLLTNSCIQFLIHAWWLVYCHQWINSASLLLFILLARTPADSSS